jgi:hypothetical protein
MEEEGMERRGVDSEPSTPSVERAIKARDDVNAVDEVVVHNVAASNYGNGLPTGTTTQAGLASFLIRMKLLFVSQDSGSATLY